MSSQRFRHRVERTRNKHSRAVFRDGTIVIRLARNLSRLEAKEHIQDLLRSMTWQLLQDAQRTLIDPFRPLLQGAQSATVRTATGKTYYFTLKPGTRTQARRTGHGWAVTISPHVRRRALHALLWRLLSHAEEERILTMTAKINARAFHAPVRRVRLRFAQSQWGSCSPKGTIMINSALLFTPPSVLKYIIVHELAHMRWKNHSHRYWQEVDRVMPTYQLAQETLQEYRLPSL